MDENKLEKKFVWDKGTLIPICFAVSMMCSIIYNSFNSDTDRTPRIESLGEKITIDYVRHNDGCGFFRVTERESYPVPVVSYYGQEFPLDFKAKQMLTGLRVGNTFTICITGQGIELRNGNQKYRVSSAILPPLLQ